MIILIGVAGYCLVKYSDGTDKLSKANSLCGINYSIGNFMDKSIFGKFDPTLGQWSNQAFKYFGQGCFYTITHINGAFDSKIQWTQTQAYNTNESSFKFKGTLQKTNQLKSNSNELQTDSQPIHRMIDENE
jgi:hypothetical protein